jgi:diacylglycerol kinase family enzyme
MSAVRPRASLIYNPNAGRRRHGRTIEGIKAALETAYDLSITPTGGPREAISLARDAATRGDAAVFAWGGDGTIREVVEGILASPVILGVLPGGTFNVVALAVGVPRDPVAAARALATARPSARDVGLINSTPFLMQATAGLEGFAMHHVRADMKARFGMAGAVIDVLRVFLRYTFPSFTVEVDGTAHEVTGALFVNIAQFGGRYEIVPGARWDDGQAQVLLYTGRSHLGALAFAIGLILGRHHRRPDVRIKAATRMTIREDPSLHIQVDGDAWRGALPATCRLASDRIQVLIPDRK